MTTTPNPSLGAQKVVDILHPVIDGIINKHTVILQDCIKCEFNKLCSEIKAPSSDINNITRRLNNIDKMQTEMSNNINNIMVKLDTIINNINQLSAAQALSSNVRVRVIPPQDNMFNCIDDIEPD